MISPVRRIFMRRSLVGHSKTIHTSSMLHTGESLLLQREARNHESMADSCPVLLHCLRVLERMHSSQLSEWMTMIGSRRKFSKMDERQFRENMLFHEWHGRDIILIPNEIFSVFICQMKELSNSRISIVSSQTLKNSMCQWSF